ncbi:MAG: zinc-binding alcohol dehydrogenase family protein [Simkaniaceae bacterium]|nr:MAG: zinc-binding alcohol dehydrogenase family protein [Simkaniaceae bacterium]
MKALVLNTHFSSLEELDLQISEVPIPTPQKGECLIEVHVSGVNPSDALGALGYFSHAHLPRIPGRDFAGVVIKGSPNIVGKKVWGTGGSAGIDTNGCHAEYLALPESSLSEIPNNLSPEEAGAQTLPYTTAYYSLVSRAQIKPNEEVLVIGGLGQVGRAALSICKWKHCHPTALVRTQEDVAAAKKLGWDATTTFDHKYDVILNTIGNVHWQPQIDSLKKFGRMAVIAAPEGKREAPLNLFHFYRANQEICGINTVDFNFEENKSFLTDLKQGFESEKLTPLPISKETTFPLTKATEAYQTVLRGTKGKRIILSIH